MKRFIFLLFVFSLYSADAPKETELLGLTFADSRPRRQSDIHREVIEGLQQELRRTQSEFEVSKGEHKCKMFIALMASAASLASGIGTVIYAVNQCNRN